MLVLYVEIIKAFQAPQNQAIMYVTTARNKVQRAFHPEGLISTPSSAGSPKSMAKADLGYRPPPYT